MEDEVNAQLGIVEIVEHHEGRVGDRVDAQLQSSVGLLCSRVDSQEILDWIVKPVTLFSDHARTENRHTLFEKCV